MSDGCARCVEACGVIVHGDQSDATKHWLTAYHRHRPRPAKGGLFASTLRTPRRIKRAKRRVQGVPENRLAALSQKAIGRLVFQRKQRSEVFRHYLLDRVPEKSTRRMIA
jgi:hypothetical protein